MANRQRQTLLKQCLPPGPVGSHNYGKSPGFVGKSTRNGPYSAAMSVSQRVWHAILRSSPGLGITWNTKSDASPRRCSAVWNGVCCGGMRPSRQSSNQEQVEVEPVVLETMPPGGWKVPWTPRTPRNLRDLDAHMSTYPNTYPWNAWRICWRWGNCWISEELFDRYDVLSLSYSIIYIYILHNTYTYIYI